MDSRAHSDLIDDLQLLRGNAYREYAPLAATLMPDGRHYQDLDNQSWHILLQNEAGRVVGCSRYRRVPLAVDQLLSSHSPLAKCPVKGPLFREAMEQQFAAARKRGLHYGEAGAWALAEEARHSTAAVNIALMSFVLAERLGGGMGVTTATMRHRSSAILRRLGGSPLGGFEPYYDPTYDCMIELLQFDIRHLEARYTAKLDDLRAQLRCTPIYCPTDASRTMDYTYSANLPIPATYRPVNQQAA